MESKRYPHRAGYRLKGEVVDVKIVDKVLDFIEIYINGILLLAMCVIIFLQIVFRHLNMPLIWTEEIARFLFVWVIYLSTSLAIRRKRHLSIDILPLFLSKRGTQILTLFSDLVGLIFFLIIGIYGAEVIQTFIARPQYSQATQTNMIIPYMAPYFGSAIASIRYIQDMILTVQKMKGDKNGEEEVAA